MSNANKEIIQRKFEALSAGSLAALDEAIGDKIVSYDASEPAPLRGREGYLAEWTSWDALGLMRQLGLVPEDER